MLTGVHDGWTEWSELSVLGHDFCKTFAVKKTVFRPCFVAHWQTMHLNYREMLENSGEVLETLMKTFFRRMMPRWTGGQQHKMGHPRSNARHAYVQPAMLI